MTTIEKQTQAAAKRFQKKNGWVPTWNQLQEFIANEPLIVAVEFASGTGLYGHKYHYKLRPGPEPEVGDYLSVWSPLTDRWELVRVADIGSDIRATKYANRIEWRVTE